MKLPTQVSDAIKRLNPDLFAVGGLQDTKRQQNQRSQSQDKQLVEGAKSLAFVVGIVSVRKRLVDEHDNLRTGAKPLCDAITSWLGFASDDDQRLTWEYGQIIGKPEGTIVRISVKQ